MPGTFTDRASGLHLAFFDRLVQRRLVVRNRADDVQADGWEAVRGELGG